MVARRGALLGALWILAAGCAGEQPLGSPGNPVKFYFTPSSDADNIATNSREFADFLEKETGLVFETGIPTSYVAVVEAFGSKRADVAIMNSFGYLMANQKYGAQARMTAIRYGSDTYKGMIIAREDSGITAIADLGGKSFAFTDSSSTSGYMFPLAMIREAGVELGNTTFAMKHDGVVTMVYQGQVDAGSCFYSPPDETGKIRDARSKVLTQFPDVEERIRIIATTEPIKNDPFVFRKDLPAEMADTIVAAMQRFLASPEGRASFERTYNFEGVKPATDADYDGLRRMIEATGLDPEDQLRR